MVEIGIQEILERVGKKVAQLTMDNEVLTLQVEKLSARLAELEPKDSDVAKSNGLSSDNPPIEAEAVN